MWQLGYIFHSVTLYRILFGKVKIFGWTELTSVTATNRVTNTFKVVSLCVDVR